MTRRWYWWLAALALLGCGDETDSSNGGCTPECDFGLTCCGGQCVNTANDVNNCGGCDSPCGGPSPYCDGQGCGDPPCDMGTLCTGTQTCCGTGCCDQGMLCCVVNQGPVGPPTCMAPDDNGTCPPGCPGCVCASPDTPVATPDGERPIADLRIGDLVYSVNRGLVVTAAVVQINRVPAPDHFVVRAVAESGAVLEMSPQHPTADRRTFGELRIGDLLGGVRIEALTVERYAHSYTHDILPASDTGAYFAAGVLVGSTLAIDPAPAPEACTAMPR
jgi:hypothetical protein